MGVGLNIADGVQLTVDDEVTDAALDTDLDRNEIYLSTTASTFDRLQIDDTDVYSLLEKYKQVFSGEYGKMDEQFALDLKLLPTVTEAICVPPRKVPRCILKRKCGHE